MTYSPVLVRGRTCRTSEASLCRRNPRIDPLLDVRQNNFLVDVVEQIVEVPLVELQRLVGRASHVVEALAAAGLGRLVERAMQDKHGEGDQAKLLLQPLVGAHHLRDSV